MTYTDDDIIKAGRILLKARKERGVDAAGTVPSVVTEALAGITLPDDDAKARGPSSVLSDETVDEVLAKLSAANATAAAKVGLAKTVLNLFGLA